METLSFTIERRPGSTHHFLCSFISSDHLSMIYQLTMYLKNKEIIIDFSVDKLYDETFQRALLLQC